MILQACNKKLSQNIVINWINFPKHGRMSCPSTNEGKGIGLQSTITTTDFDIYPCTQPPPQSLDKRCQWTVSTVGSNGTLAYIPRRYRGIHLGGEKQERLIFLLKEIRGLTWTQTRDPSIRNKCSTTTLSLSQTFIIQKSPILHRHTSYEHILNIRMSNEFAYCSKMARKSDGSTYDFNNHCLLTVNCHMLLIKVCILTVPLISHTNMVSQDCEMQVVFLVWWYEKFGMLKFNL